MLAIKKMRIKLGLQSNKRAIVFFFLFNQGGPQHNCNYSTCLGHVRAEGSVHAAASNAQHHAQIDGHPFRGCSSAVTAHWIERTECFDVSVC